MPSSITIPAPLRTLTGGRDTITAEGATVAALLESADRQYPGIRARILDDAGQLRRFVNLYVNGEDVRFLQGLNTDVKDSDELSIVPAIAGG